MSILVIVVYNRLANLKHWMHCLTMCDPMPVVVIHNSNEPAPEYEAVCKDVTYIRRPNVGYDIGAFQDVCKNRLQGFPEWERLLWVTDDTFPMCTNFMRVFDFKHEPGTVTAMQISPYVRRHIRTTGFMIDRSTAQGLVFPADPIITKEHCYQFEHRSTDKHFLAQLQANQVAPDNLSPLWDIGYHRRLDRHAEHIAIFGEYDKPDTVEMQEKTTIICPIHFSYPAIISSLLMQTYTNWELWLIHDGPGDGSSIPEQRDHRIKYFETETHCGYWGHSIRAEWLQRVASKYVVITNPDNYYAPQFFEKAIAAMIVKGTTVATYCDKMIHSYKQWEIIQVRVQRGYIDCGGVVLKAEQAKAVGWRNVTDHSADWLFFNDIARTYGMQKFVPFKGCHFIHN